MKDTSNAMIIRNVPDSIRREFKSLCAKEGKSMQEKIVELMKQFIEKAIEVFIEAEKS